MGTFGQTFAKTLGFFTAIITLFFGTFFIISIINNFTDIQYNNYDFLKGAKSSENKIILLELNGPILNQSSTNELESMSLLTSSRVAGDVPKQLKPFHFNTDNQ